MCHTVVLCTCIVAVLTLFVCIFKHSQNFAKKRIPQPCHAFDLNQLRSGDLTENPVLNNTTLQQLLYLSLVVFIFDSFSLLTLSVRLATATVGTTCLQSVQQRFCDLAAEYFRTSVIRAAIGHTCAQCSFCACFHFFHQ